MKIFFFFKKKKVTSAMIPNHVVNPHIAKLLQLANIADSYFCVFTIQLEVSSIITNVEVNDGKRKTTIFTKMWSIKKAIFFFFYRYRPDNLIYETEVLSQNLSLPPRQELTLSGYPPFPSIPGRVWRTLKSWGSKFCRIEINRLIIFFFVSIEFNVHTLWKNVKLSF